MTWSFPPVSYLSGAAYGLCVLRRGSPDALRIAAWAIAIAGLISFSAERAIALACVLWMPVLIVGVKAYFDVNLYLYLDNTWILIQILVGLACIIFGIWLSQQYAAQKITSPFLNKVVDNISLNDFTGRSLASAIAFLNDIEAFEKEEG